MSGSSAPATRPQVWEFRWREPGADGKRKHRRLVIGTVLQFVDEVAASAAVKALKLGINSNDARCSKILVLSALVDHFRQQELAVDKRWRTQSTKDTYEGYLRKWVLPRWGTYKLRDIKAVEVESWLWNLPLAPASCCKIRSVMSLVFNHAIRHDLFDRNPISFVRQSAKRRAIPKLLSATEIERLLLELRLRERTLVLLAAGTGLRMGELFGLKWKDVSFDTGQISVVRSIVNQIVGPCKTETSRKPVPLDPDLAQALQTWQKEASYTKPDDWIFASPHDAGRKPYRGHSLLRHFIRPAAVKLGITTRFGWHTFRHTYSTLLKATGPT